MAFFARFWAMCCSRSSTLMCLVFLLPFLESKDFTNEFEASNAYGDETAKNHLLR